MMWLSCSCCYERMTLKCSVKILQSNRERHWQNSHRSRIETLHDMRVSIEFHPQQQKHDTGIYDGDYRIEIDSLHTSLVYKKNGFC